MEINDARFRNKERRVSMNKTEELIPLSPSRVSVCSDCSWRYWCSYKLKLPEKKSTAQTRGTLVHKVLEVFLNSKCTNFVTEVLGFGGISIRSPIYKFTQSLCKKEGLTSELDIILEMIMIGLETDFYCKGNKSLQAEVRFDITDDEYKFRLKGFIDVLADMGDHTLIRDYKTSKNKKTKKDLTSDIQGMMYSLAGYKLTGKQPRMQFLFLRFPKKPIQDYIYPLDQLEGLKTYLAQVQQKIQKFNVDDSTKNLAKGGSKWRMLCGTGNTGEHTCAYMKPFSYYAVVDEDGNVMKTSFSSELIVKEGQTLIRKSYAGCPAFGIVEDTSDILD